MHNKKTQSDAPVLSFEPAVGRYGWGWFTPNYIQIFDSPKWALTFCSTGPLIQGFLINGLLHFVIPTLERQFDLSSCRSGLIASAYDMASVVCLLPVATFGGRPGAHKPRFIGIGLIVLGTGAIVFSSPAFFGPYHQRNLNEICPSPRREKSLDKGIFDGLKLGWILFFGNLLHGAGASPIYSLGVTFIDECFSIKSSSFYISIYYIMAAIGPLLGTICGGLTSHFSVNSFIYPSEVNLEDSGARNPYWVGCWWLGFVLAGVLCFIFSIPVLGIHRELKGTKANLALRGLVESSNSQIPLKTIGELPMGLLHLMKNFTYLFLTLGACCEGIIFSGMASFATKILLQQFGLGPKNQAIYKAVIAIPSSLIGILGGGWVIKFYSMNLRQILTMMIILLSIGSPFIGALFLYCSHEDVVGFTYENEQLVKECNKHCNCDRSFFFPVCGSDGKTYFSACFAGCSEKQLIKGMQTFRDCLCIEVKQPSRHDAKEGFCTSDCQKLPIFVVMIFAYQTLASFCFVPVITCTLRVVHTDLRSLGVALQWVMGRMLGTIPGPLIFGLAIDGSCRYWQENGDGSSGRCLEYHNHILARSEEYPPLIVIFYIIVSMIGGIIITFGLFSSVPHTEKYSRRVPQITRRV